MLKLFPRAILATPLQSSADSAVRSVNVGLNIGNPRERKRIKMFYAEHNTELSPNKTAAIEVSVLHMFRGLESFTFTWCLSL